MSDFLYHKITENERKVIENQAKEIMDNFAKKLERIDESMLEEPIVERDICERKEGPNACGIIDRKIMFENASKKNKDFIIAEKKKW